MSKAIDDLLNEFNSSVEALDETQRENTLFSDELEEAEGLESQENDETTQNIFDESYESEENEQETDETTSDEGEAVKDNGIGIPSDVLIEVGNVLISNILNVSLTYFGKKCDKKDFVLDASEKKAIKKPLDTWLNSIEMKELTPLQQLLLALGLIYGAKILPVMLTKQGVQVSEIKKEEKKSSGRGRPRKNV